VTGPPDSKEAEKTYLSRSGGGAWEREKPFPPEGTELFTESLELLNDFVVAMKLLQPGPEDRILDLGAGAGWASDLLQRMNRKSVAVDISTEMLRVARQRASRRPIPVVAGDFESLPFTSGSFDKAVCLSALHHVPNMKIAVREIGRVLNDTGVVVFSEPGVGHDEKPWSVSATQDFGVLEQEVLIESLIAMCRDAGFAHVHVCPISYVIPEFELSDKEWRAWMKLPRIKRPIRAAEKMWRALLELLGRGKDTALFEEAFAMRLVRLLQVPVQEHPFVIASKSAERRRARPQYLASLEVSGLPPSAKCGEVLTASIAVANRGATMWRHASSGGVQVRVGIQLLDHDGRLTTKDFARAELPHDLTPEGRASFAVSFAAPSAPGQYRVKFDLVAEGVTWFEPVGTKTVSVPVEILE